MAKPLSLNSSVFQVQLKHILPNAVTILALCSGMTGLIYAGDSAFGAAIACILVAAILDACDGRVARATGGTSKFGAELDSLADVVCFGAVPAFTLYKAWLEDLGLIGWAACLTLLASAALRLARFNVSTEDAARPSWMTHFFCGIPAPAGAYLALLPFYLVFSGLISSEHAAYVALASSLSVAFLMVSRIPTFSTKSLSRKAVRLYFVPSVGLAMGLAVVFFWWPWHGLALAGLLYTLSLPLSFWRYAIYAKRSG